MKTSLDSFENAVAVSALKRFGIDNLLQAVHQFLFEKEYPITLELPYSEGNLINLVHNFGNIQRIEYKSHHIFIQGSLPGRLLAKVRPYLSKKDGSCETSTFTSEI